MRFISGGGAGGDITGGRAACVVSALWPGRVERPCQLRRLQYPGDGEFLQARRSRGGGAALVSVLLSHRARPQRPEPEAPRDFPTAVEDVVADLRVRRCDVRAIGCVVRERRFRRCRDPLLSASLRQRRRRSALCGGRSAIGGAAEDQRADDQSSWRRGWRDTAPRVGRACKILPAHISAACWRASATTRRRKRRKRLPRRCWSFAGARRVALSS